MRGFSFTLPVVNVLQHAGTRPCAVAGNAGLELHLHSECGGRRGDGSGVDSSGVTPIMALPRRLLSSTDECTEPRWGVREGFRNEPPAE